MKYSSNVSRGLASPSNFANPAPQLLLLLAATIRFGSVAIAPEHQVLLAILQKAAFLPFVPHTEMYIYVSV